MYLMQNLNNTSIRRILLIAMLLRAIWGYLVPVGLVADSSLYDAFATSIASGNGYAFSNGDITVYWPVGTSAVYAVIYRIFGVSHHTIVVFNILLGVAIVWLTYAITLRYLSRQTAFVAAWIVTLWPLLIQYTTILASELIFIFLVLLAIYIWGSKNIPPLARAILWGALVCAATYVRPIALPILLLLPVIEFLMHQKLQQCLVSVAVASLTAAILFAPWAMRNHTVFGHYVLVSANGGTNLWMGNNPDSNGGYMKLPNLRFRNEVERDIYFKQQAVNYIREHPFQYIRLSVLRTIMTYKAENIGVVWNGSIVKNSSLSTVFVMKLISSLYWLFVLMSAVIGSYLLLKRKEIGISHVLILIPAFLFIVPILTVGQDRYHIPLNPFLAILAAYALNSFHKRRNLVKISINQ